MPWMLAGKCVHKKKSDGSMGARVACHETIEEAKKHMAALYKNAPEAASATFSFEQLSDDFDPNKPFKVVPEGVWHRGKRVLEVTGARLKEMAANFAKGFPQYRVGINLDHAETGGKVGDITEVAYMPDGEKGPGLYATKVDWKDKGLKAIQEEGYDGVSAEIVWTLLDGNKYQDPATGKEYDNVLTGMALTPRPFFGHNQLALYSAKDDKFCNEVAMSPYKPYGGAASFEEYDAYEEAAKLAKGAQDTTYTFRTLLDNILDDEAIENKTGAINKLTAEFEVRMKQSPEEMGFLRKLYEAFRGTGENASDIPEVDESSAAGAQEVMEMADEKELLEARQAAEKLTADLKVAQDAEKAAKERGDQLEAQIKADKLAVRKAALKMEAEAYKNLSLKTDEYVEKFAALEDKDAELAEWFRVQLKVADGANREVMGEIGSDRENDGGESDQFLQSVEGILKESFSGDRTRYSEAMVLALTKFPKLAAAYQAQV